MGDELTIKSTRLFENQMLSPKQIAASKMQKKRKQRKRTLETLPADETGTPPAAKHAVPGHHAVTVIGKLARPSSSGKSKELNSDYQPRHVA